MFDGGVYVLVGVGLQQPPDRMVTFEGNPAALFRHVKQCRNDGIFADVFGNVLFGVIRSHFLLVDVLLKNITKNIRIDFIAFLGRAVVQVPLVLLEEIEDALESFIGDLDVLSVFLLNLVL